MPPSGHALLRSSIGGRLRAADALVLDCCRWTAVRPQTSQPRSFSSSYTSTSILRPHIPPRHPSLSQCRPFSRTTLRSASAAAGSSGTSNSNRPPSPSQPSPQPDSSSSPTTTSELDDRLKPSYFLSNTILDRVAGLSPGSALPSAAEVLPHRRRKARRQAQVEAAASPSIASSSSISPSSSSSSSSSAGDLPANASTILTDMAASQTSVRRLASSLLSLAKPRLTMLVVLTAMAPYALYPVPSFLSPELIDAPSLSPLTLLFLTTGTALCSASANALNMLYEPDTDSRMSRTRNRPLVRSLVSRRAALLFAIGCGVVGVAALEWGVNPTTAFLGAANIALYAGVYTPMKRLSVLNTWVGALVGGIPPLMGWTAAAGEASTYSQSRKNAEGGDNPREFRELLFAPDGSSAGGWLLAALLFAWQFPHFMALSWAVRHEYQRAGLRMLAWVNPARNGRVALRYSIAFVPICVGLCATGVTSWSFAVTSLPVNVWLVREAVKFWRFEGHQGSARTLFWASVWHLPVLMVLALLQKKGMWTRVYRSVMGEPAYDDEDEFYDDDEEDEDALGPAPPGKQSDTPR
ncbi:protoheme ix farnesyltransferase [Ophiostoma piceae UAMH 11346]|uniref:Protoheme IX farnesyltransferase, mitochondrial n=1 Tax=Ophiostoma piceae (strain UAMH 11346) TaxID=1262450 RepID=S3C4S0_OPHP1|nr:protoheme ix farnesyltransferase [Ophiostoma piceae UAMH 11346]